MKLILASILTALALSCAASAQEPAPPSPATLVEEVEIIARLPGPALWRVSTATSQIWLLALASPLPKGFQWDDRRVAKALDGARALVIPPVATAGLGDIIGLVFDSGHVLHLPPGQTVRSGLPPELRERWEEAARSVGKDPAHYDHWRPVLAAAALTGDAISHDGMVPGGAVFHVAGMAKQRHVKVRGLASYKAMDMIKSLSATSDEVSQACIAMAADTAFTLKEDTPKRAAAWARGDLAAVRASNGRSADCLDRLPAITDFKDRAAADWAKELKTDLVQPGKVVVAVDLDSLTRKGGLLDQLKAEGLEVIGPPY